MRALRHARPLLEQMPLQEVLDIAQAALEVAHCKAANSEACAECGHPLKAHKGLGCTGTILVFGPRGGSCLWKCCCSGKWEPSAASELVGKWEDNRTVPSNHLRRAKKIAKGEEK